MPENVTITKSKLVAHITSNRKKHADEYTAMVKGYRKKCKEIFEKNLKILEAELPKDTPPEFEPLPDLPKHHLEEYDKLSRMLSWETNDRVTLSEQEFMNYIEDNWYWKTTWRTSLYFLSDIDDLRPESER